MLLKEPMGLYATFFILETSSSPCPDLELRLCCVLSCLKCQEPRSALANGAHRESDPLPRPTSKISNTLPSFCHPVLSFPTYPQKRRNVPEEPTNKWKQRVRTAMAGVKLVLLCLGASQALTPSAGLLGHYVCPWLPLWCVLRTFPCVTPPHLPPAACHVLQRHCMAVRNPQGVEAASCGVLETCLSRLSTIASCFLASMLADTSGMSGLPCDISASMLGSSVVLSLKAPPTHT